MSKLNEFRFIGFDLDNTLFDQNAYNLNVVKEFSSQLDFDESYLIEAYKKSYNSSDFIKTTLLNAGIFSEKNHNLFFEIYKTTKRSVNLFESACKALMELSSIKEVKIFLVTNGVVDVQRNKVELLRLHNYMDLIVYARTWGPENEKPNAMPFEFVYKTLGGQPSDYLMFGDSYVNDVQPVLKLGWSAELVDFDFDFYKYIFAQ